MELTTNDNYVRTDLYGERTRYLSGFKKTYTLSVFHLKTHEKHPICMSK